MALVPTAKTPAPTELMSDSNKIKSDTSNSFALVTSLPEQWPMPQEPRKRFYNNLLFTNVTHTSVNKAQAHLELLQNAIEDWQATREPSQVSRTEKSAIKSQVSSNDAVSKKMADLLDGNDNLEVIGVGQTQPTFHYFEDEPGIPYLGAEEVVEEVIQLMVKLENERLQAEEEIRRERNRVIDLAARIDMLTEAKLLRIPEAVQAEHEACIEDIAELNWHVQAKKKSLEKSRRIHAKSTRINSQIKEEIAYIKEHDPLVREKLQIELSKIGDIKEVGANTEQELKVTQDLQRKTEKKNEAAHSTANQERARLKAEIDKATDNLAKAKDAVVKSEEQFTELCKRIVAAKEQHKLNQAEIEVLAVKNSAAEQKQLMLQASVDELQRQLRHEEHQGRVLDDEVYESQDNHQKQKSNQEAKEAEMQSAVNHSEDKFIFIRREADEQTMELESMQDKLKECEQQKVDDEKNLVRMDKELERTKEDMVKTLEQFSKVTKEHTSVAKKLESEEKKVMFVEDSLKASIAQLQRQVQEEMSTRDNLIHRIETDTRDLGKNREEAKVKKHKLKKMAEKMTDLVQQIRVKVEKLRKEAAEKKAAADEQQRRLDALLEEKRQTEQRLDSLIAELQPQHESQGQQVEQLKVKLEDMNQQIDQMNKKITDIYDQTGMIKRTQMKFKDAIVQLEQQQESLNKELSQSQRSDDSLKAQVSAIEARINSKSDEHTRLQEQRKETERELETQYQAALSANKRLAGEYRAHQNETLRMKEQLLDLLHEILLHEEAVKDIKQGQRLQEKTHFALKYFLRCKQDLVELQMEDYQFRGRNNQRRTAVLDGEIQRSLSGISEFLQSQMHVLMQGQRVQQQQQQQQQQTV